MSYEWPGNVRELQNVIHNTVVLHDGEHVTPEMLPPPLSLVTPSVPVSKVPPAAEPGIAPAPTPSGARPSDVKSLSAEIRPLAAVEREYIEGAIARCDGNIRTAAALLGIAPQTIYRKRSAWEEEDAAAAQTG